MTVTINGTSGITTPTDTITTSATVAGVNVVAVAPGTSGNILTSNGSAWTSSAPTGSAVPAATAIGQIPFSTDGSTYSAVQKIVQGTSVASTSGTSIDFTSIPSWVKRVTVMFQGVSTSGSSQVIIQLGTAGGIVNTGYLGGASVFTSGILTQNLTSGFSFYFYTNDAAPAVRNGSFSICNFTGNNWTGTGGMALSNAVSSSFTTGIVPIGAALTFIRITTVNGTDTFDAGSINLLWE
jgi:hypothetical protein